MHGFITFIVCLDFVKFNLDFSLNFVFISVIRHFWVWYVIYVGFILYFGNILNLLSCFRLVICGELFIFLFGVIRIYDFLRLNSLWRKNLGNCPILWIIFALIIIILCSFLWYELFKIKCMHLIFILMRELKVSLLIKWFLLLYFNIEPVASIFYRFVHLNFLVLLIFLDILHSFTDFQSI